MRRNATYAAAEAGDDAERDALAETARVDPEPIVRASAIRALTGIGRRSKDPNAIMEKLRDLWNAAEDPEREDIALAWSSPDLYKAGGREVLRLKAAEDDGPGSIAASAALLRVAPSDADVIGIAIGQLTHAIDAGSRVERLHALALTPMKYPEIVQATAVLAGLEGEESKRGDVEETVVALGRLTEVAKYKEKATLTLERIAGAKAGAQVSEEEGKRPRSVNVRHVTLARFTLARAKDLKAQSWVEEDLTNKDPDVRAQAGFALAMLDRPTRAAPLLADEERTVRLRASCTILVYARTH